MKPGLNLRRLSPPGTCLVCIVLLVCILCASCKQDAASGSGQHDTPKSEILIKKRKDGTLVTNFPEIRFREEDHPGSRNRQDLHVYSAPVNPGIKYYIVQSQQEEESRA